MFVKWQGHISDLIIIISSKFLDKKIIVYEALVRKKHRKMGNLRSNPFSAPHPIKNSMFRLGIERSNKHGFEIKKIHTTKTR